MKPSKAIATGVKIAIPHNTNPTLSKYPPLSVLVQSTVSVMQFKLHIELINYKCLATTTFVKMTPLYSSKEQYIWQTRFVSVGI